MAFLTNLYPPILPEVLPAFVNTTTCIIKYNVSPYTDMSQVKTLHITMVNVKTGASILKYSTGIKFSSIFKSQNENDTYQYRAQVSLDDLKEGKFEIGELYQIQLRFSSYDTIATDKNGNPIGLAMYNGTAWLYNHRDYFSEWSKGCIVKAIGQPTLSLRGFDGDNLNTEFSFNSQFTDIIGNLQFKTEEKDNKNGAELKRQSREFLSHYNIKIYNRADLNTPIYESEQIYPISQAENEINYTLNYNLQCGVPYLLELNYTTNNLYTATETRKFRLNDVGYNKLDADITATIDEQRGIANVNLKSKNNKTFIGIVTIRRSSSKSNFTIWEDVWSDTVYMEGGLDYTWSDKTIESGVWYHYCAERRDSLGNRGAIIQTQVPVMILLDDIFLTTAQAQLRIRFNPSINEFKYNVAQSQQIGLGAKYPIIKRNANNFYRSFPISGLISSFMDTTDWYDPHFHDGSFHYDENQIKDFTSKSEVYGDNQQLYSNYNYNHDINEYNDYIYERNFREKVYQFLYKHDVKLFRSTTEGNILIKLINLDFQPVETLGRRLYSFSATAVQVDEANIKNYNKYLIQDLGTYTNKVFLSGLSVLGQLYGRFAYVGLHQSDYFTDRNLFNNIQGKISRKAVKQITQQDLERYDTIAANLADYKYRVTHLKWLRIEFTSKPYLIDNINGYLRRVDLEDELKQIRKIYKDYDPSKRNLISGYIVKINGKQILVRSTIQRRMFNYNQQGQDKSYQRIINVGYLELKEPNTKITDIRIMYSSTATIDYIANVNIEERTENLIANATSEHKVGQIARVFQPGERIIRAIYSKYIQKYTREEDGEEKDFFQAIRDVRGISIQGPVGAVVKIQDAFDENNYDTHILANGFLRLREDEVDITGLYFEGIKLTAAETGRTEPRETQYYNSGQAYDSSIVPHENWVYTDGNKNKIYYHSQWFDFENEIVKCPIDASINYYFVLQKGQYA